MDQDGSNGGGEIKDIFSRKNRENEMMSSYGFLMCTNKMISHRKRSSWKSKGGWESYLGNARFEVPGDNSREISRKISISSYSRLR